MSRPGRPVSPAFLLAATLLALAPAAGAAAGRGPTPNDPAFLTQWQLADDRVMGARSAWRATTGGPVVVAVVDTGAQLDHPDLAPNLWINEREQPGNGVDDDRNGHVDDVHGYDFANGDGRPADDHGHGTHVAGIIGARGDNRVGIAGVAWRARLMIVKALRRDGSGSQRAVADAVRYAAANGARIVNLSMTSRDPDRELQAALAEARDAGVLVVAAAGNAATDLDTTPLYPASSAADNVVAVASTDEHGRVAKDSGFGRATVHVAAPGESIGSTARGGRYAVRSGTSQAAAVVTGVLALMAAERPRATGQELRAALLAGARASRLPVAAGTLDAARALRVLAGGATARRAAAGSRRAARARSAGRPAQRAGRALSIAP